MSKLYWLMDELGYCNLVLLRRDEELMDMVCFLAAELTLLEEF